MTSAAGRMDAATESLVRVGRRFGRHTAIYAAASVATLFTGLASVGVFTRYMRPSEYGVLALLLFFSALLTVLYTLGVLQGAFLSTFGASGDEESGDDSGTATWSKGREALGTTLLLIALLGAAGTAAIAYFAPWFADLVVGNRKDADLIRLAAAAGALGAVWRFVHNVLRMERRPGAYFVLNVTRPVLV